MGRRSFKTFNIFLNGSESFAGGAFNFLEPNGDGFKIVTSIRPVLGSALVFDEYLLHEGAVLEGGEKWIMRSEIVYVLTKPMPALSSWDVFFFHSESQEQELCQADDEVAIHCTVHKVLSSGHVSDALWSSRDCWCGAVWPKPVHHECQNGAVQFVLGRDREVPEALHECVSKLAVGGRAVFVKNVETSHLALQGYAFDIEVLDKSRFHQTCGWDVAGRKYKVRQLGTELLHLLENPAQPKGIKRKSSWCLAGA